MHCSSITLQKTLRGLTIRTKYQSSLSSQTFKSRKYRTMGGAPEISLDLQWRSAVVGVGLKSDERCDYLRGLVDMGR